MLYIDEYKNKEIKEYKKLIYGVWHNQAFKRTKKLPVLTSILNKIDPKTKKTNDNINIDKIIRVATQNGLKIPKSLLNERG